MARWTRLIPAVAVTLVLAACGQDTTDTPFSPPAPSYDAGGNSLGSNYAPPPPDDGSAQTTTNTTSSDPTGLPSDTTSRGGNSLGSN